MSPPGTVLFINKSVNSKILTRSEGLERKEIYSHVQQLPLSKASDKGVVISWKVRTGSDSKADNKSSKSSPRRRSSDEDGSRCRRKKTKAGRTKAKKTSASDDESVQNISRLLDRVSVSITAMNVSELDPFDCSPVPMDARVTATLKIFCSSMTNRIFTIKSWAHASLRRILTYASETPELLYAVLCSTSGEMYAKSQDQTFEYNSIYFKGMALTHLQKSIDAAETEAKSPNVATVRAVCTLLYLACIQNELPTAHHHYLALQNLITKIPHIEQTPLAMRTSFVIPTLFCTSLLAAPPLRISIAHALPTDELPAYTTELLNRFDRHLVQPTEPSRFSNPATEALLGPSLNTTITKIQAIETGSDIQTLFAERISLAQDLQEPIGMETPQENLIRISLYLSLLPLNAANSIASPFKTHLSSQLLPSLKQTSEMETWFPCLDLYLWVLCVSAWVFDGEEGVFGWIGELVGGVAGVLGLKGREGVVGCLRGFVWAEKQMGGVAGRLCEGVFGMDENKLL